MTFADCLKSFALVGAVTAGTIIVAGCGQSPQAPTPPAEETQVETPAVKVTPIAIPEKPAANPQPDQAPASTPVAVPAPAPAPAPAPPAVEQSPVTPAAAAPKIAPRAKVQADFVKLFAEQQKFEKSGEKSKEKDKEFADRWKAVTATMVPKTLIKGLDLLAVDTMSTGPKEYTFYILLHTTADLDTDYHLSVMGKVDESNVQHIKPTKPGANYTSWPYFLDSTSQWKAGEYHLAKLKVETELIPYDLSVILQIRDAQNKVTDNPGNRVELGWQSDAHPFVKLAMREQEYKKAAKNSKAAEQAFAEQWKALTRKMQPKPLIDGLEMLAVDTQATGPKEYTFSFLLHTTADLDKDYHLSVMGKVDQSHLQHIKPSKEGANYTSWPLFLYDDPTSKWKAGEYHVVQLKVATEPIPYNLSVILQTRDAQNKWTGNPGNRVELGWQAAINE